MTMVQDLVMPAKQWPDLPAVVLPPLVPTQPAPAVPSAVPTDVLDELRHISECYRACRAKADLLRVRPSSGAAADRDARDDLHRALQRLHELRERRSVLLDAHDLPSRTGARR
ncbi:MAG: hypothetical protein ACJ735_08310 [Actinomycetes bacterium]